MSVAGRNAQRTKSRQERGFPEANTSQTWPRLSLYYSKYPRDLCCGYHSALNIKFLEPLAQGASRFEKLLAPQKSTGPQFFSNDVSPSKTVVDIKHWNN